MQVAMQLLPTVLYCCPFRSRFRISMSFLFLFLGLIHLLLSKFFYVWLFDWIFCDSNDLLYWRIVWVYNIPELTSEKQWERRQIAVR